MAHAASDIKTRALSLMGEGAPEETKGLETLCAAASGELIARLKEGVRVSEIEESFVTAAGLLAIAMYMELGAAEDLASVRAGNVSVSRRSAGSVRSSAASLRREAEALLAAYLVDRGFDFRGVRG